MSNASQSKRRFLNDSKDAIVDEDDPTAAFLLAAVGDAIPDEYADLPYKSFSKADNKAVSKADNK